MSFKKNKYKVVRQAITKQLTDFIFHYFQNKRRVSKILFDSRYISPFTEYWGTWDDGQIPKTYSHYADGVFETLLEGLHERVEKDQRAGDLVRQDEASLECSSLYYLETSPLDMVLR